MFETAHKSSPSRLDSLELRETLDEGAGWVVVEGFPIGQELESTARTFEKLMEPIGAVTRHGETGQAIWQITPRQDLEHLPTFSETSSEAPLHTDNSWVASPEKYMALLVVRPATSGGDSVVLSLEEALGAFGKSLVGRRAIRLMTRLCFPFATPDVFAHKSSAKGNRAFAVAPIIDSVKGFRFRYDVIQAGFDLCPKLATPEAVWAVDVFNHFLKDWLERKSSPMRLKAGDLLIANNHRTLHARTPFNDDSRLLLRARMS